MPAVASTASRKTAEAEIAVRPINGFIGAEIEGVDLRQPLSPAQFKVVHDALVRYEVIVLRDQDITIDQQMAFGALFGELFDLSLLAQPAGQARGHHPRLFQGQPAGLDRHMACRRDVSRGAAAGHHPARQSRAGGRRRHAVRQHERRLSRALRTHEAAYPRAGSAARLQALAAAVRETDRPRLRKLEDDFPNPWHPVVRVHPVSGRRVLYVNRQFCVRIKGLKSDESDALLEFLYRQATTPEYQLRVKWQPNTLVCGTTARSSTTPCTTTIRRAGPWSA